MAWGNSATQYFYQLTPECILDHIEQSTGLQCTGRVQALNSLENRVYEIEIINDEAQHPYDNFIIAKFYRPGRWSEQQILAEHQFLHELQQADIPVVAPRFFIDKKTLHYANSIYYTTFPKMSGRNPEELSFDELAIIGRLLARLHTVGATQKSISRINLTPDTYGRANLHYLIENDFLPPEIKQDYIQMVNAICDKSDPWFKCVKMQRIHGDCHLGNLLQGQHGFYWVDFDDMVIGPPVQDVWLIVPGRDEESQIRLRHLLDAYLSFCDFDRKSLRLIEPLRALRYINFSAWIAKRRDDPAFLHAFPDFGTPRYWLQQLTDLQQQWALMA
ncbi:MAG: serine/threonine protein kinase [Legionellales bacterium]|nr:serine/threonine protein kinase [Legionellales bacterium]